ncbi:MAG TPA: protein kinase [Burkholderiales bacterium]|nr:protein kinase [Burkholderiales bacterium]
MTPEVLLVDDAEEFRQLAAQFLAIEWPAVEVDEWDPHARGEIPEFYPLGGYDALLLDYDLGFGDGLEWLVRLVRRDDCPPVVFVIDAEDENVITEAKQRGAFDYLCKGDLSRARLVEAVRAAAEERTARSARRRALRMKVVQRVDDKAKFSGGMPAQEPPAVVINGYRMLEKIGSGGMSSVYLAERATDCLRLVMKIMNAKLADDQEFLMRFIQEYGLLSKIDCPQVVRIHDQGVTDRHVYIAMEHFAGGDLRARIRNGLAPTAALDILQDVARALKAVHEQGIVHRDLKPDNVMFRADGSLAIADFGIATKNSGVADLTAHGDVLGTPHYLSPEQACAKPLDGRSDLYSLGILFFEMLTGRRPFQAKDAVSLAHKHVHEPLPRLPAKLARYQEMVDCLTAKRPPDRFAGAHELLAYLEANAATLCGAAETLALIDQERAASNGRVQIGSVPALRSAQHKPTKQASSKSAPDAADTDMHTPADTPRTLLNVPATLARLRGNPALTSDAERMFTRTVPILLMLLADALNDSNLPFIYEAAQSLKTAAAAVEAPEVLNSVIELQTHVKRRDFGAVTAAFRATDKLMRRLTREFAEMARA